jgi:N-methylhydantoinase A
MRGTETLGYNIGVDTGGTFTDLIAQHAGSGDLIVAKALSTPQATHHAIEAALEKAGLGKEDIDYFVHGTTIATNALIERTGARCAFITTRGFRDILHIQRLIRPRAYDLAWMKPRPLVARADCFELAERIGSGGEILTPLDEARLREIAQRLVDQGITAVAVGFLFAYANPAHELRAREILAQAAPGVAVSLSHEVFAQWREYERFSTTVVDTFIRPIVSRYADNMEGFVQSRGVGRFFIMRSNGGVMTSEMARDRPIALVRSGPAAGVIAACAIGRLMNEPNLLTADMGGTSFDTCLIANGEATLTTQAELEWSIPIAAPMVDVRSVGAGGGSIGWLDLAGSLKVGPQSARSMPGPACYGRGGDQPTVTDANLMLGRLDPSAPLAGDLHLDKDASAGAIGRLAAALGRDPIEVAAGITDIADNHMAQALRLVSVDRGHDPRRFAIMAFGGAGPLPAANLARLLGARRIIVPVFPGAFSALGCLMADARFDYRKTAITRSDRIDPAVLKEILDGLQRQALEDFDREGYCEQPAMTCSVEMRYAGQNWELDVPVDVGRPMEEALNEARRLFEAAHDERFGWHMDGSHFELVHFKVSAAISRGLFRLPERPAGAMPEPEGMRDVLFPGTSAFVPTRVYSRDKLPAHAVFEGPVVVSELASTTLVPPGATAQVDAYGNLLIAIG